MYGERKKWQVFAVDPPETLVLTLDLANLNNKRNTIKKIPNTSSISIIALFITL